MIQNEDAVGLALYEGKTILIPCEDEKDAKSKYVSLTHARSKLPRNLQSQVQIRKVFLQATWMVRVKKVIPSYLELTSTGEIIPFIPNNSLSITGQLLLDEMQAQSISQKDILAILLEKGEKESAIQQALLSYSH